MTFFWLSHPNSSHAYLSLKMKVTTKESLRIVFHKKQPVEQNRVVCIFRYDLSPVTQHVIMTSRQDITSPPSPPSSRVILQPWRWCQRRDPVSHRRTQWPHCAPLAALFSPWTWRHNEALILSGQRGWQARCQVLFFQSLFVSWTHEESLFKTTERHFLKDWSPLSTVWGEHRCWCCCVTCVHLT